MVTHRRRRFSRMETSWLKWGFPCPR